MVPVGRAWTGRVHWTGCMNRHHNQMSVIITGNHPDEHFSSRMFIDAVIIETWTENHKQVRAFSVRDACSRTWLSQE